MNNENTDKRIESSKSILKVLSDEEWHKYGELLEKTKISSRTLTKRLDDLQDRKLIQKEEREPRKRYPSAYYKAEPELVTATKATILTEELSEDIEPALIEIKNPMVILELINLQNSLSLTSNLIEELKGNNISESKLYFLLELFVWEPYKALTWKLIEAIKKNRDIIDIEQIEKYQLEKTLEFVRNSAKLLERK